MWGKAAKSTGVANFSIVYIVIIHIKIIVIGVGQNLSNSRPEHSCNSVSVI